MFSNGFTLSSLKIICGGKTVENISKISERHSVNGSLDKALQKNQGIY